MAEVNWNEVGPRLLAALRGLSMNPYLSLADKIYDIRETEGKGWEGSAVRAWSDAVAQTAALLKELEGV